MTYHDISLALAPAAPRYPGKLAPRRDILMAEGAPAKCSAVSLDCPVGTHVDAPRHFVRDGIPILEWIDRTDVGAGEYELLVLPLKLAGAEAARARAVPGS